MLAQCTNGTFLLRFSDSELGGVTIAWVSGNLQKCTFYFKNSYKHIVADKTEVFMLQPFTSKDFAIRSLADRINDLQHLIYLYKDICKESAFGKYYTPYAGKNLF